MGVNPRAPHGGALSTPFPLEKFSIPVELAAQSGHVTAPFRGVKAARKNGAFGILPLRVFRVFLLLRNCGMLGSTKE